MIKSKIRFYAYILYSLLFFAIGILVLIFDFKYFKAGGGSGGSIVLVLGSIISFLLSGNLGKYVLSGLAVLCGLYYLNKAKKQ